MLYLEDKNEVITNYTLPGYTLDQVKAKVWELKWDLKYPMPTLAYIEVTKELRHQGLAKQLLKQVMKERLYLIFQNDNNSFWQNVSDDRYLPFITLLHGNDWGELISFKKCSNLHVY